MKEEDLQEFGMTKTEAKIYNVLLNLGKTKIGPIIKKTGLHRGTVYNSLVKLIVKGFVSTHNTGNKNANIYSITGLDIFKEVIKNEEEDIKEKKEKLKNFQKRKNVKEKEPRITVRTGKKGFKSFFSELLEWGKNTEEEYFFMGRGQEMIKYLDKNYYIKTQNIKRKNNVKCRVVLNEVARKESVSEHVSGNVRYLSLKYMSPTSTWIFDNKVVIVLWKVDPIKTIIINSSEVYDSYKSFFEILWGRAN